MKTFVIFVAIGTFFATVEEFLTIVVLRCDVPSYLFSSKSSVGLARGNLATSVAEEERSP